MKISIGKAAEELGCTKETFEDGKVQEKLSWSVPQKVIDVMILQNCGGFCPQKKHSESKRTIAYARVSSMIKGRSSIARRRT